MADLPPPIPPSEGKVIFDALIYLASIPVLVSALWMSLTKGYGLDRKTERQASRLVNVDKGNLYEIVPTSYVMCDLSGQW